MLSPMMRAKIRTLMETRLGGKTDSDADPDSDGVPNDQDAFPDDASENKDTDGDKIGDNTDSDRDGDGVPNDQDAFPDDASENKDTDGDKIGDNADINNKNVASCLKQH